MNRLPVLSIVTEWEQDHALIRRARVRLRRASGRVSAGGQDAVRRSAPRCAGILLPSVWSSAGRVPARLALAEVSRRPDATNALSSAWRVRLPFSRPNVVTKIVPRTSTSSKNTTMQSISSKREPADDRNATVRVSKSRRGTGSAIPVLRREWRRRRRTGRGSACCPSRGQYTAISSASGPSVASTRAPAHDDAGTGFAHNAQRRALAGGE